MFRTSTRSPGSRLTRSLASGGLLVAFAVLAACGVASAQKEGWTPDGVQVATSPADRVFPVAVHDDEGGVYVTWQEWAQIRLQRLTAEGSVAPGWSASIGREVCPPVGTGGYWQSSPRAISDQAGGVYVLWHDERNSGCFSGCLGDPKQIYVQRFGPDGSIAPGWPALALGVGSWLARMGPTPGGTRGYAGEMNTVAVGDGRGGLLIAWIEQNIRGNTEPGLRVQRISPAGELLWGERGVRVCAAPGAPVFPTLAADRLGGAVVVWQDERNLVDGPRLYVQRLSRDGVPLLAPNGERATTGLEPRERFPRLAGVVRDGAMLVWEAGATGERGLFARRLRLPERKPLPGPDRVARTSSPEVRLTPKTLPEGEIALLGEASGGAWVAWIDVRQSGSLDLYAHRLLYNGMLFPGWPADGAPVATSPSDDRSRPMLVADGASGAFVGWRDAAEPRVTLLTPGGEVADGWPSGGLALTSQPGVDRGLDLVADNRSGAIGVWDQWLAQVGMDDVRAQRVEIVLGTRAPFVRLPLERAELSARGEVAFALEGFRPNPSRGPLTVALALPAAEPATLELFDLAGRRVAEREVGGLGAGRHLVRLDPGTWIAPGVYLLRLTQGARTATARAVVSH